MLILFAYATSFSQNNDTLKLEEVAVTPRLKDFSVTQNIIPVDTLLRVMHIANNLGQLLQSHNSVFVKSYGPSAVGTTSMRGGSAAHTAVTWNGMNMRNAMLGENDLSMLSVFMNDDVQIQYGGSTAMWGSGSVAGSIHLGNEPRFNRGFSFSSLLSNASFGNNTIAAKTDYGNKRFYTTTRVLVKTADNDFSFYDADGERKKTGYAEVRMTGILHEDHFRINSAQTFSIRYWTQNAEREIPPLLSQDASSATQFDIFHRAMAEWQLRKEKWKLMLRNGVFYERLRYIDSSLSVFSDAASITNATETELVVKLQNQNKLQVGINNTYCMAETDNYVSAARQNYSSLFAGYHWSSKNEKHFATLNLREEITNGKFLPFTASAAFSSALCSLLEVKASVNKLYRLPSFNSLYWNPGGNPDLLPEDGFSEDLSVILKHKRNVLRGRIDIRIQGTVFSRVINNWIIWLPGANGIWSPENLLRVWSRGAESNSAVAFTAKKLTVRLLLRTNYVLSSNQRSKSAHDESVGRQLIYTPMYSGSAGFQLKYKRVYFSYIHNYTGYRYITADNYDYLSPFDLADMSAGASFAAKKVFFDLSFTVSNVKLL